MIAFLCLLLITSCGPNNGSHSITVESDTVTHQTSAAPTSKTYLRNQLTDTMLAQIISHYNNEYGDDSTRLEISRSDTLVELMYRAVSGDPEFDGAWLFAVNISLVTDIDQILVGDLNSDGHDDMLVSVYTAGGGTGGNVEWSDHFVFFDDLNGSYLLSDVKSDDDVVGGWGHFSPEVISKQVITGTTNEYAKDDGHCCPTLYYDINLRCINGKLTTINKKKIAKPAKDG